MKNLFVTAALSFVSLSAYACPELVGRYNKCKSEVNPNMRGEYLIEQHQENNYMVYNVQFIDDETGEARNDIIVTNGVKVSRKERVPKIGIKVRIDASSSCTQDAVVTNSQIYFLGSNVGYFVTKIYRSGTTLHSDIDGQYTGKEIHKRITCELE